MSLFLAPIPFFECLVRREYTRNLEDRLGEYLSAKAIAVRCQRGRMLAFQVVFDDEAGGAMFLLPIEALVWKDCPKQDQNDVCPWDCLSDTFSAATLELLSGMRCVVLPRRLAGRYMFTVQYGHSELADDPTQHKQHHVVRFDDGWFGAFPNNRLLMDDKAMFPATTERPDFLPLQHIFGE